MAAKPCVVDKKQKFWPCSRTKLQLVHSSISLIALAACFVVLHFFDGLLTIGNALQSPVLWILALSEMIKCVVNRKMLRIVPQLKPPVELPAQNQPTVIRAQNPHYVQVVCKSIFVLGAATAFAAAVCILFGAPVLREHDKTLSLAVQLVIVSILPFVLFLGPNGTMQYLFCDYFKLASKNQTGYLDMVHYNAVFALFGAWASSAVAPLDWDRPWQAYPVPNMCGTLAGLLAGNLYAMALATHRYRVKRSNQILETKSN